MRWLFWTGGLVTVGGLWWLLQGTDLATGGDETAILGGGVLFLVGLLMVGLGMRSMVGDQ